MGRQLQPSAIPNSLSRVSQHPLEQIGNEVDSQSTVDLAAENNSPATKIASTYIQFEGHSEPNYQLAKEQPWHRYALHLMARAKMSATEVAKIVGCSPATVRNLTKQSWFREKYDQLVSNRADSLYQQLLEGEDVHSLLTMIELRDNPEAPAAVRAKCAFDIIDRMHGKAVQTVHSTNTIVNKKDDIESMQAELLELDRQEKELLGASSGPQKLLPGESNDRR